MLPSYGVSLAADSFGDALDGVMSGECRSFLPANEVREIITGEVGSALGFFELDVCGPAAFEVIVCEAAEGVGDLRPANVDRFGE